MIIDNEKIKIALSLVTRVICCRGRKPRITWHSPR